MTKERIIEELTNRGFHVVPMTISKNGITIETINIRNENGLSPTIYINELINRAKQFDISLEEVVDKIIEIYKDAKNRDFDTEEFFNKDFIKENIFIAVQRTTSEKIEKRDTFLDGIESYLYIRKKKEDDIYSAKVTEDILKNIGFDKEELWELAEKNTLKETTIISMIDLMKEILLKNESDEEFNEEFKELIDEMEKEAIEKQMFVITNNIRIRGASCVLNKKVLEEVSKKLGTNKIVLLPSSLHEMIAVPYTEGCKATFDDMVAEVNVSQVSPLERLTNRAYIIEL